jgi:hypothetical protein
VVLTLAKFLAKMSAKLLATVTSARARNTKGGSITVPSVDLLFDWFGISFMTTDNIWGGVKTERVFPGLSVLWKNNKMEVLSPEKWKYYPRKNKNKKR